MEKVKNILDTPIAYLKGVGPKKSELLINELDVNTFGDLLDCFPFRYIDKTKVHKIRDITPQTQYIQLKGILTNIQTFGEKRSRRLVAKLKDGTGSIELIWFRGVNYWAKNLQNGHEYLVFGKPAFFRNKANLPHPEIEIVNNQEVAAASRMQPVYSTTEKLKSRSLDSKGIYRLIKTLFDKIGAKDVIENLPLAIREEHHLIDRWKAYKNLHLPKDHEIIDKALFRLKFEEYFFIQLRIYQIKLDRDRKSDGYHFPQLGDYFHTFYKEHLPFELTGAQKRVLKEVRRDTLSGKQMNRLLQGDVGSGKTIVALMSMLMGMDNGFQACLMAPTEILAQQHFNGISKMLKGLGLDVELLTGSVKGRKRRDVLEKLHMGMTDILIGTHALIEDAVVFKNLGMIIIDEQHRFGVAQRAKLWKKNDKPPHVLVTTATPIPRTLAMTVYGDLEVSVIDELPPGRKPIKTFHMYENKRLRVLNFVKQEIDKGRQAYIVYPLINESETLNYKDLMDGYESITRYFPEPDYQVSVVHGQMHTSDKDLEMQRFKEGKTNIMVATTVIEVGVDVPNATVMVIESAERFGLAQLHQLRGRVGRGGVQSYCVLMTDVKLSTVGRKRLQTMVDTTDGFKIAEVDMQLRGPGDLEGTQQSGLMNLKVGNVAQDGSIIALARQAARKVMKADPTLDQPENLVVKRHLAASKTDDRQYWSRIS